MTLIYINEKRLTDGSFAYSVQIGAHGDAIEALTENSAEAMAEIFRKAISNLGCDVAEVVYA